jgi:hypothetical protein
MVNRFVSLIVFGFGRNDTSIGSLMSILVFVILLDCIMCVLVARCSIWYLYYCRGNVALVDHGNSRLLLSSASLFVLVLWHCVI